MKHRQARLELGSPGPQHLEHFPVPPDHRDGGAERQNVLPEVLPVGMNLLEGLQVGLELCYSLAEPLILLGDGLELAGGLRRGRV